MLHHIVSKNEKKMQKYFTLDLYDIETLFTPLCTGLLNPKQSTLSPSMSFSIRQLLWTNTFDLCNNEFLLTQSSYGIIIISL